MAAILTENWISVTKVGVPLHFAAMLILAPHLLSQAFAGVPPDAWSWIGLVLAFPGIFALLASGNCLLGVVFLAITSLLWGAVLSALYVVVAAGAQYLWHHLVRRSS